MAWIISVIIWLVLSVLVGRYAEEHGLSKLVFIILSLLISPLFSFIIALIVKKH